MAVRLLAAIGVYSCSFVVPCLSLPRKGGFTPLVGVYARGVFTHPCGGIKAVIQDKARFTQIAQIYSSERIQDPISGGFFINPLLAIGMPVKVFVICLIICLHICGSRPPPGVHPPQGGINPEGDKGCSVFPGYASPAGIGKGCCSLGCISPPLPLFVRPPPHRPIPTRASRASKPDRARSPTS